MKIQVVREACCFQDDQIGPLEMCLDLPQECRLDQFLTEVARSGFLQFSSTHTQMVCRMSGGEVALVFTPHRFFARKPVFMAPSDSLIRALAGADAVEFLFRQESGAIG